MHPDEWNLVYTPDAQEICERIIGCSLPVDGRIIIISYAGVHLVNLHDPDQITHDDQYPEGEKIYDRQKHVITYQGRGFPIIGVFGGFPITQSIYHEQLTLSSEKKSLYTTRVCKVQRQDGPIILDFRFDDASGDWAYFTFSDDFDFLLAVAPYDLTVFRRIK